MGRPNKEKSRTIYTGPAEPEFLLHNDNMPGIASKAFSITVADTGEDLNVAFFNDSLHFEFSYHLVVETIGNTAAFSGSKVLLTGSNQEFKDQKTGHQTSLFVSSKHLGRVCIPSQVCWDTVSKTEMRNFFPHWNTTSLRMRRMLQSKNMHFGGQFKPGEWS